MKALLCLIVLCVPALAQTDQPWRMPGTQKVNQPKPVETKAQETTAQKPGDAATNATAAVQSTRSSDYPEYGVISDIKDLRKIYVYAEDSDSRAMIIKMLGAYKGLEVVSGPREAEMVLEFSTLTRDVAANRGPYARGASMALKSQMQVVMFKPDGTKVIAWTETETLDVKNAFTFSAPNEMNLTHHFVRDLQKARGEKPSSIRDLNKGPRKDKKK